MDAKQLITHSMLKDFRSCKKRFYFKNELCVVPAKDSEPLFFGATMHNLIEAWLTHDRDIAAAFDYLDKLKMEDPYLKAKLEVLITGYHMAYEDEPYKVVLVETEYRAPLINPETMRASQTFDLGGKLDAIYQELRSLKEFMKETKTTVDDISPESDYWKKLLIDGQVSGYYLGAESIDHKVEGCLYDVIRKPGIRPSAVPLVDGEGIKIVLDASGQRVKTKDGKKFRETGDTVAGYVLQTRPETPEEFKKRLEDEVLSNLPKYYARKEVPRTDSDLRDYLQDVWDEVQTLREKQKKQNFVRNPEACVTPYGTCPYWEVCTGQASIEDPNLFKKSKKHAELERVA